MDKKPCDNNVKTPIGIGSFLERAKQQSEEKLTGVIVVKASLKNQWLNEISKFSDLKAIVLQTYKSSVKSESAKIKARQKKMDQLIKEYAINNADEIAILKNEITELEKQAEITFNSMFDKNKYDLFIVNYETIVDEKVRYKLHELNIQFWYIDEADCIKNNKAQRSKAIYEFKYAKYKFGATATPIRKNPKDLFGIFSFLNPKLFPSESIFDNTYLKFYFGRVSGSQNEELLAKKVEPYFFKRNYDEIASQLPKQTVIQLYCEFTDKQFRMNNTLMAEIEEYKEQEKSMHARFSPQQLQNNAEYKQLEANIVARQTFAQMLADDEELLRSSESNLAHKYLTNSKSTKVELCMELLEKIIDSGEKVCIFSRFIGIQEILEKEIENNASMEGIVVSKITGSVSDKERAIILDQYNTMDNHQILLLSDAGEAGINLSQTRYLIEFDLADSAAKQTQRHGRIQRADSKHNHVFVYQLICRDSWDEIAQKIIAKKGEYADRIL